VFVVEMEMVILGSHQFSLIPSQNSSKSPKWRYCVVENCLSFLLKEFFIHNFDDVWKSMVIEIITPPLIISCLAYSFFNSKKFGGIDLYIRFLTLPTRFSQLVVVSINSYSSFFLLLPSRTLGALTSCLKIVPVGHF
jgi:hypothetical protein